MTGTSDMSPMDRQLQLFKDLKPDIEKSELFIILVEPNSLIQVNQAKELAEGLGLEIIDVGINTINDIALAMDSLVGKCRWNIHYNRQHGSIQYRFSS